MDLFPKYTIYIIYYLFKWEQYQEDINIFQITNVGIDYYFLYSKYNAKLYLI